MFYLLNAKTFFPNSITNKFNHCLLIDLSFCIILLDLGITIQNTNILIIIINPFLFLNLQEIFILKDHKPHHLLNMKLIEILSKKNHFLIGINIFIFIFAFSNY